MAKPLKVLIVEDHPLDAELMVRELGQCFGATYPGTLFQPSLDQA